MIKNQTIQKFLEREVDRKEFVKILGAALLGVVGFTSFVKNIEKFALVSNKPKTEKKIESGYGYSAYGR